MLDTSGDGDLSRKELALGLFSKFVFNNMSVPLD
jgi:hypothetical protein